nr:transposase [Aminobacter niigataensis]
MIRLAGLGLARLGAMAKITHSDLPYDVLVLADRGSLSCRVGPLNLGATKLSSGGKKQIGPIDGQRFVAQIVLIEKEEDMRRQTRPFIVEVKQRRSPTKKQSIWGNLNIAAVDAETMRDLERDEPTSLSLIDSGAPSIDVAGEDNPLVEHNMPDPQEAETAEAVAEAPASVDAPEPKKKAPRPKKAKSAPKSWIAKEAVIPASKAVDTQRAPARAKRKTYSENERAQLLAKIQKAIGVGVSIKAAVGEAGISEQTYYQWKRATETVAPAADLNDLLALEEENKQLKKQLAERLRHENAELKKKLGLK